MTEMRSFRILVLKMGGGYLRAILLNGQETVFGRDVGELIGRLKRRAGELRMHHRDIEQALDFRR
jgi:hypothetical protein